MDKTAELRSCAEIGVLKSQLAVFQSKKRQLQILNLLHRILNFRPSTEKHCLEPEFVGKPHFHKDDICRDVLLTAIQAQEGEKETG